MKNDFIDKYVYELESVIHSVVEEDATLTRLTKNKIYRPRVLNKMENTTVIKPIVMTSENKDQQQAYYKKTGCEIHILNQVNDTMYYVRMGNTKNKCMIRTKDIVFK